MVKITEATYDRLLDEMIIRLRIHGRIELVGSDIEADLDNHTIVKAYSQGIVILHLVKCQDELLVMSKLPTEEELWAYDKIANRWEGDLTDPTDLLVDEQACSSLGLTI